MTRIALLALALSFSAVVASAECTNSLELGCPDRSTPDQRVIIKIHVTNCQDSVEIFSFDLSTPYLMDYVDVETEGTLVSSWFFVTATAVDPQTIRVSGFSSPGFDTVDNEILIKVILVPDPPPDLPWGGFRLEVSETSLTGDLAGFDGAACGWSVMVPVKHTTWGAIKALYD
jgi:hypothetical protein